MSEPQNGHLASSTLDGGSTGALPRACIVGAGSSGITAAKALVDRGIPFDCFERSDRIGGNWVFANRNGMSSSYSTLHINTSRERMEYADYPMPATYPDFPRHDQIARYFEDYVEHFDLRKRITFETGVEHARKREDGVWEVTLEGEGVSGGRDERVAQSAGGRLAETGTDWGDTRSARIPKSASAEGERLPASVGPLARETRCYDALLVANGHHWDPRWPEPPIPGSFDGEQIHAHDYKEPQPARGSAGGGGGDGQLRDGHRRRRLLPLALHHAGGAARRARGTQVHPRPAARQRGAAEPHTVHVAAARDAVAAAHDGWFDGSLRAATARPPSRAGASHRLLAHPRPPRPRRDRRPAADRRARG